MSQLFFRNPLQIFVNYDKIENEISAPLCVLSDFCERSWHFSCFRQHIGSKSSLPADMMHQASNRPQYCPAAGYQLIKEFRHMAKIRVAVLFGGVSSEHDVSLISAENVIRSIFQSTPSAWRETAKLHRKAFFISPILVQSCKKGCKRLHSAPEKMVFFEKREKNLVRNLQHLSVRL